MYECKLKYFLIKFFKKWLISVNYSVYSDGSVGNITMEFPLFCNEVSSSDVSADQLTVRVVAGVRMDRQIVTSYTESFTVLVTSSGLLGDVMSSLDIVIQQTVTCQNTPYRWILDFMKGVGHMYLFGSFRNLNIPTTFTLSLL